MRQIKSQLPADCVEERSHHRYPSDQFSEARAAALWCWTPERCSASSSQCIAMYAKPWGIAPPPAAAGEQCYVAGHRRGAQPASSSQCMVQDCLSEMPNGKWLKGCQPLCAVKKKCVAAKQCGTILSGVRPSPPPFFDNAKILKTWFYLVWCELRVMDQLLPYTMPCCCA